MLAQSVGMTLNDVEQMLIGGSFGQYLNVEKAIQIGLLPDLPWDRFHFLGNTAARGAYMALLRRDARDEIAAIAKKMTYLGTLGGQHVHRSIYGGAVPAAHGYDPVSECGEGVGGTRGVGSKQNADNIELFFLILTNHQFISPYHLPQIRAQRCNAVWFALDGNRLVMTIGRHIRQSEAHSQQFARRGCAERYARQGFGRGRVARKRAFCKATKQRRRKNCSRRNTVAVDDVRRGGTQHGTRLSRNRARRRNKVWKCKN